MVDRYIEEIYSALENKLYFPALALALTLPDICGNTEYPNESSVAKKYIGWFDKYIRPDISLAGEYTNKDGQSSSPPERMADLTGEIVYNLRNSFLHSGNAAINSSKIKDEKNLLDVFVLILDDGTHIQIASTHSEIPCLMEINVIYIDVSYLCRIISQSALWYYKNNAEKFKFDHIAVPYEDMPVMHEQIKKAINQKLETSGSSQRIS